MLDELKDKTAVIDIGSNTIRLVIYENPSIGNHFKEIENIKRAARLRNYLNDQHCLTNEGITLLIETLLRFQRLLDLHGIKEVICVATAAIRQANNKETIAKTIQEKTGLTINILSEYEEAYYGYLSVIHSIDLSEGITIDMGGGSTELTYFRDRKLVHFISLPFGSLSLRSQFIKGDTADEADLLQIRHYLHSQFEKIPWILEKKVPVIAMGGSARNAARIHQSLIQYPLAGIHQYEMNVTDLGVVEERLKQISFEDLQNLDGLSKDRADTILPALEVFKLVCGLSNSSKFILSRKGLRDGVLLSRRKLAEEDFAALIDSNIQELRQDYHIDFKKGNHLKKTAAMIFQQVKAVKGIGDNLSTLDLTLLKRGAYLFHLGKYINDESSSYTYYLLANRTIAGLSHKERVKLALVASYKGKGAFRQYIEPFKNWFSKEERKKLCLLGAILKLSHSLNTLERDIVHDIKITPNGDFWAMNIECHDHYEPEQYQLERQKKHIEKLLKIKLVPEFHLVNEC